MTEKQADKKEEALIDFIKGLRIVLNNASAYFKDHPYFRKSVEAFKQKVDSTFPFLNPIKIDVAPNSLFIDGKYWDKMPMFLELAQAFHLRKIKSIQFSEGVSIDELVSFLSSVSMPIKEILRNGGLQVMLGKEKAEHISVGELDYSELLQAEGEEYKDIWIYIFKGALGTKDQQQINRIADNFEKNIDKFKAKDVLQDEEFKQSVCSFLNVLKNTEHERFYRCTKGLLRIILKDQDIPQQEKLQKINELFEELNKDDVAECLLDALQKDESFNYLNFAVFSRLFSDEKHKEISSSLLGKISNKEFLDNHPKIRKKIKELFSVPESSFITPLYRKALTWLSEENPQEEYFSFSADDAQTNYRFLLINLLVYEDNQETISLISGSLLKECDNLFAERNLQFLKLLLDVLNRKIKANSSLTEVFHKLHESVSIFIENLFFEEEPVEEMEYFSENLRKSALGFSFYAEKIIEKGIVNAYILKLLLRFFPINMPEFYKLMEKRHADIDFMDKLVKTLAKIDNFLSLEVLKRVFIMSGNTIKVEVLKAMQQLSRCDNEFLFLILRSDSRMLKKEALLALLKSGPDREDALNKLLLMPSRFGRNNKAIIDNVDLIEEIGFKEAAGYMEPLSKRRFFWNRQLRERAKEVLNKWRS